MTTSSLGQIIYSYIEDHLKTQKGLRPLSIKSYRDTLRLFLVFAARDAGRRIARLTLADLTFERVLNFLGYLEAERRNQVRTRNQRLAALHSFFEYTASRVPEMMAVAERVAAIPSKRTPLNETRFLDRDELSSLFAGLPATESSATRDRALLLFLYNTGARVQEVADLKVANLELDSPARVHLHGKGDKWRSCPLWEETAAQLRTLIAARKSSDASAPVFVSRSGHPLTRFGIYKIVRRRTQRLRAAQPSVHRRGIPRMCFVIPLRSICSRPASRSTSFAAGWGTPASSPPTATPRSAPKPKRPHFVPASLRSKLLRDPAQTPYGGMTKLCSIGSVLSDRYVPILPVQLPPPQPSDSSRQHNRGGHITTIMWRAT